MDIKKLSLLILLIVLFISSCAPKREIPLSRPLSLRVQGDRAWEHKDYSKAFRLYTRAYSQGLIPENKRISYLKKIIVCGEKLGYYQEAGKFLSIWKNLFPKAPSRWEYLSLYLPYLLSTRGREATLKYVMELCKDSTVPFTTRKEASFWILKSYLKDNLIEKGTKPLYGLYVCSSLKEKKDLEYTLLSFLMNNSFQFPLTAKWEELPEDVFPANLIKWFFLIKMAKEKEIAWPLVYEKLCKILHSDILIRDVLKSQLSSLTQKFGVPIIKMAFVLPLGGAYGDISWKILEGVEAALYEWQKTGIKAQIIVINSLCPGWINKLGEILNDTFIIGGPIREEAWREIAKKGLDKKGAFFLFRTDIPESKEGVDAFRFFPSHRDQIRAVVNFLMKQFNIMRYGILYPRGEYGRTMAEEFWSYVTHKGGKITALSWYRPDNPSMWQKKVEKFLQIPANIFDSKNKTKIQNFVPSLDFDAVFLPDSFENVQVLVPNFFYFNCYRLFFLGTTLWSGEKFNLTGMDKRVFRLAIFPSPWVDNSKNNPYLLTLTKEIYFLSKDTPSLWSSLGYDFFRFSMELLYRQVKTKKEVLQLLPEIEIPWTLAPIKWDKRGIAREEMYLLQPLTPGGKEIDIEKLKMYYGYIKGPKQTNNTLIQEK